LGLTGFVKNQCGDVLIEVEGDPQALDRFLTDIATSPPPLARIAGLHWKRCSAQGEARFRIDPSEASASRQIFILPDVATCRECLAEIRNPADRRHRYPFTNCTRCGPRLTIVTGAPYDRERTTMAGFTMCAGCRAEYESPPERGGPVDCGGRSAGVVRHRALFRQDWRDERPWWLPPHLRCPRGGSCR
jgi:hydrogenase maturation protein HypF